MIQFYKATTPVESWWDSEQPTSLTPISHGEYLRIQALPSTIEEALYAPEYNWNAYGPILSRSEIEAIATNPESGGQYQWILDSGEGIWGAMYVGTRTIPNPAKMGNFAAVMYPENWEFVPHTWESRSAGIITGGYLLRPDWEDWPKRKDISPIIWRASNLPVAYGDYRDDMPFDIFEGMASDRGPGAVNLTENRGYYWIEVAIKQKIPLRFISYQYQYFGDSFELMHHEMHDSNFWHSDTFKIIMMYVSFALAVAGPLTSALSAAASTGATGGSAVASGASAAAGGTLIGGDIATVSLSSYAAAGGSLIGGDIVTVSLNEAMTASQGFTTLSSLWNDFTDAWSNSILGGVKSKVYQEGLRKVTSTLNPSSVSGVSTTTPLGLRTIGASTAATTGATASAMDVDESTYVEDIGVDEYEEEISLNKDMGWLLLLGVLATYMYQRR